MKKEDVYARMMHTPDDPARAELRAALRDIWTQLLPLHRALINSARDEYAANVAPLPLDASLKPMQQLDRTLCEVRDRFGKSRQEWVLLEMEYAGGAAACGEVAGRGAPAAPAG